MACNKEFRRDFSTVDHIHVVKQVLQKLQEYNKSYYIGFIDYSKAFDSIEHKAIWSALETQGVHKKYIKLIQEVYSKSTAEIQLENTGPEFPITRGVRQGDPISPKLFSAVLEIRVRGYISRDIIS